MPCSCETDTSCNKQFIKLYKKYFKLRNKYRKIYNNKRLVKKIGKCCFPSCQTGLIQQCDATGCYDNFQPYAIFDSMGPTKPGTRRERCCCMRKQIAKMQKDL